MAIGLLGLDGRTEEDAEAEGFESYWPNIERWLLERRNQSMGSESPLHSEPCPLIKCVICREEVLLCRNKTVGAAIHLPSNYREYKRFKKYREISGRVHDLSDAPGVHHLLPGLTGRETDDGVAMGCCDNIIGLRCLLTLAISSHRRSINCPFCRKKIPGKFVAHFLQWINWKAGMCVLCHGHVGRYTETGAAVATRRFTEAACAAASSELDAKITDLSPDNQIYIKTMKWASKRPYRLPACGHKFCISCLEAFVYEDYAVDKETGRKDMDKWHPRCPICRVTIQIDTVADIHEKVWCQTGRCIDCQRPMTETLEDGSAASTLSLKHRQQGTEIKPDVRRHDSLVLESCGHRVGSSCLYKAMRDYRKLGRLPECPICFVAMTEDDQDRIECQRIASKMRRAGWLEFETGLAEEEDEDEKDCQDHSHMQLDLDRAVQSTC